MNHQSYKKTPKTIPPILTDNIISKQKNNFHPAHKGKATRNARLRHAKNLGKPEVRASGMSKKLRSWKRAPPAPQKFWEGRSARLWLAKKFGKLEAAASSSAEILRG